MIRALVLVALFTTSTTFAAPDPKQLAGARVTAADRMYQGAIAAIKTGRAVVETAYVWSVRQLEAELDSGLLLKQALLDHQKRMTGLDAEMTKMRTAGVVGNLDADAAAYFKLEADYWVAKGKR